MSPRAEPAPSAAPRRVMLGGRRGVMSSLRVYRTADALEAEEVEGYDVTRRSVLLDEVLLVTLHRTVGWGFVLGMAVLLTFATAASGIAAIADRWTGLWVFTLSGLPAFVAAALRLALRLDVVTVYGVRSRVAMAFWFRKRRAREVFTLVCRLAREEQQRLARDRARAQQTSPLPAPPVDALPIPS